MRFNQGLRLLALMAVLAAGFNYAWAEPQVIPQEIATQIGKQLISQAETDDKAPFKLEGDADKATGLHEDKVGAFLVIPVKGIKDGSELKGVDGPNGAGAGYLFLHKLALVADGKPVAEDKFATSTIKDPEGNDRQILTLRLAIKKDSGDKWSLLVFGKDKKPIATAPFRAESNGSDMPFSVSVKDVGGDQGTLVVTFVGKYAADVRLAKAQ